MPASVFGQLLPFSFRGIGAPIQELDDAGSQAHADHEYADRDGTQVEGTGRKANIWSVTMVFVNGLERGSSETWGDDLYPAQYLKMIAALEDRSSGDMNHPERGKVRVKPGEWHASLSADYRGGKVLKATFKETTEPDASNGTGSSAGGTQSSPLASVRATSQALSSELSSLSPPVPEPSVSGQSLSNFMDSVASIGDQFSLFGNQIMGKINGFTADLYRVRDAFASIGDTGQSGGFRLFASQTAGDPPKLPPQLSPTGSVIVPSAELGNSNARIVALCNRLINELLKLQASLLVKDVEVAYYVVAAPSTLASTASRLKNTIDEIVQLNPGLLTKPVLPIETLVRYYKR